MANGQEEVGVKVGVQVDGQQTLSALKKDLKEAQGEALAISRQFGETSKQAQEAAKKVAMIKDEMGDLNERVQLFDPGAKFQVFGNVVNSVAAGFTAAQGAMAVFGGESEDLQRQLVKLQGALALTQGLSAITDSWKDFQRLGGIIKTQVVTAFSTLKGAIAATGIGLLVIAIATLVTNFEAVEKWLKKIIPGFESFGAVFNKVKAIAFGAFNAITEGFKVVWDVISNIFTGDFSAAADAARNAGSRIGAAYAEGFNEEVKDQMQSIANEAITLRVKYYDRELKVLRAQGEKSTAAVQEMERKRLETILKNTELTFEARKEAETELRAFDAAAATEREKAAQDAAKKAEDQRKQNGQKALQELQQQQELEYRRAVLAGNDVYMLKAQQLEEQLELSRKYGFDLAAIQNQQAQEELARREALSKLLKDDVTARDAAIMVTLVNAGIAQKQLADEQIANNERLNQSDIARRQLVEAEERAKQDMVRATGAVLEAGAQLAGEQTALGKTLAIASTTIQTYSAAQSAYQAAFLPVPTYASPFIGAAFAAAAVISGLARVKQILSIKVPGANSGSSPAISAAATAPAVPRVQANTGMVVDQLGQINSNLQQPQRVQVVESDITNTQNRVQVIENNAKF